MERYLLSGNTVKEIRHIRKR